MTTTLHAGALASGLLLLLFPADRLLSSSVELRTFGCFRRLDHSPGPRPWWWVPILWFDPVRAFVGAWLITWPLPARDVEWAALPKTACGLTIALLAAGVLCQLFTRRDRTVLLAPMGFVAGVVVALVPWHVAALGLTIAVTAMLAFRQFQVFFIAGFLTIGVLGFVLKAEIPWLLSALAMLALPIAASVAMERTLEIPAWRAPVRTRP
jgi:hypothetical protein